MKKILLVLVGVCLLTLLAGEVVLRVAGAGDFPLYEVDAEIGYIPSPSQSGKFMNRADWKVNQKSHGAESWNPNGTRDLLLIGDSLVWGMNNYPHDARLGAALEAKLDGWQVWPAGAGSWGVLNEIAYMDRYPDVTKEADQIVWILNSVDLGEKSVWQSDLVQPRSKPASVLFYGMNKYFLPRIAPPHAASGGNGDKNRILPDSCDALATRIGKIKSQQPSTAILLVSYPTRSEFKQISPHKTQYSAFAEALRSHSNGAEVIDVAQDSHWKESYYRDSIHPTPEGNIALAELISRRVQMR